MVSNNRLGHAYDAQFVLKGLRKLNIPLNITPDSSELVTFFHLFRYSELFPTVASDSC